MKTTAKRFCKTLLPLLLAVTMVAGLLVGCAGKKDYTNGGRGNGDYFAPAEEAGAELYSKANPDKDNAEEPSDAFVENPFIDTARQNVSTFSADVDTASYALFRKTVTGWVRQKANIHKEDFHPAPSQLSYFRLLRPQALCPSFHRHYLLFCQ